MRTPKRKRSAAKRGRPVRIKRKAGRMPLRANSRWYADMGDLLKLKDTNHIGGLLQEPAVSVLHGDANTLKTFTALAIASSVAYGLPLVPGGPRCKRGIALFVAFEDARGFKARRLAWLHYHGLPAKNLSVDAVKIVNPYDEDIGDLPGIDFDLLDDVKVGKFIDHAQSLAKLGRLPIRLIVIDVLRDAVHGILSTKTFRLAGDNARRIVASLGCHVMILHHNTKNSERMVGPASLEGLIQQRFLLRRYGRHCQLIVMKNRDGQTGGAIDLTAHRMIMGLERNKKPVDSLAIQFLGIAEEEIQEANSDKVLQLCDGFEPDTSMTEAQLLKASGMSVDGRGGMQRTLLRKWIPSLTTNAKGIIVHNGGTDWRRFFREQRGKRWVYYCQAVTAAEAKDEMREESSRRRQPKDEPEVARKKANAKKAGGRKAA